MHSLQANFSVCNVIESSLCYDYVKIENLLESICEIISDENAKAYVRLMLKDNKPHFRKIEKLIKKLQEFPKATVIDRKEGYNQLVDLYKVITEFKECIRAMVDKSDRTYRKVCNNKLRKQEFPPQDLEV